MSPSSQFELVNLGRGGYNGPASTSTSSDEEDSSSCSQPLNFGRGGYNRGPPYGDDDEEEDGRGGYN